MILLDTNILIDLLEPRSAWAEWTRDAVAKAMMNGDLATSVVVLAECARHFGSTEEQLDFLDAVGITPRPLGPSAAFRAGRAHRAYRKAGGAREAILADFLIAGHAFDLGAALMTRDRHRFVAYFPDLSLITPETHPHG